MAKILPSWLVLVIVYFVIFVLNFKANTSVELYITYTFLLNVIISAYSIFSDRYPYSLNKIFWIFNCIFFCVIPTYQFQLNEVPWGNNIAPLTFLYANLIITACFLLYKGVRWYVISVSEKKSVKVKDKISPTYVWKWKTGGRFIFVALCIVLALTIGIQNLWLRGDVSEAAERSADSTYYLLFDQMLRGNILYYVLVTIIIRKRKLATGPILFLILLCSFLVNFPLSTPRFFAAAFYISILIVMNVGIFKTRNGFVYIILIVLLLIFPLLGVTRYKADKAVSTLQNTDALFHDSFVVGDFDAYSSFCRTIEYVSENGSTIGKQLLTVLLFFVPREVWPGKSIGSGAFIYGEMRYDFTNISCPYIAEGYINFGIVGSFFFMIGMSIFLTKYDLFYWRVKNHFDTLIINYNIVYYPIFIGLLFFVLRGDLLSSFSNAFGLYVAGRFLHYYLKMKTRLV